MVPIQKLTNRLQIMLTLVLDTLSIDPSHYHSSPNLPHLSNQQKDRNGYNPPHDLRLNNHRVRYPLKFKHNLLAL